MIPAYALIEFQGNGAPTFLQAQLATDLRDSVDLQWRWAALCTLKGRVLGTGPLLRIRAERWLWLVHATLAESLIAHLQRYLLRSKLTISQLNSVRLSATPAPVARRADQQLQRIEEIDEQRWVAEDLPLGWDLTLNLDSQAPEDDDQPPTQWELARLKQGLAMLNATSTDQHLSHTLELPLLRAVSLTKGCYPGQEIIARTHYLGRNKRTLALVLATDSTLSVGDVIECAGRVAGTVVETTAGGHAIAAVPIEALESDSWVINGALVTWSKPTLPDASKPAQTGKS